MRLLSKQQFIKNGALYADRKHISGSCAEHGHDFFELEFIHDGSGKYVIDGTSYSIHKNMLFFMSPVNFHTLKDCEADIISVIFSCNTCGSDLLFPLLSLNTTMLLPSPDDSIFIEKLLQEIHYGYEHNHLDYAVKFLHCLLYKITSLVPSAPRQPSSHIQKAILFILENFRHNITLQTVSDYVGIVPQYLSNLFLEETGIHFKVYLDNLRFDYAAMLLTSTDLNITEICFQSGFCDYANFARRFKKRYGKTPNTYRKNE